MDYNNTDKLYEDAKQSLRKFKGDPCPSQVSQFNPAIKLESACITGSRNEEAFLSSYNRGPFREPWSRDDHSHRSRSNPPGHFSWGRGSRHPNYNRRSYSQARQSNPIGHNGKIMTCKSCGSFRHLIAQCPDSWENMARVNVTNEENVVLYTGNKAENVAKLGVEAQNSVVLDSACSSTVCGKTWLDNYVNSLDNGEKSKIVKANGSKTFKFGGGTCLKSLAMYTIPATLAGHDVRIKTDVVESDIPLLLSRKAMKSAQVKLDLENDTAVIFGEEVMLNLTSSGHYCVPIDNCDKLNVESVFAIRIDENDYKCQKEALLKLHRQFAHPPTNKLVALLKDAGSWRQCFLDVLEVIYQECDLCKQYAKTPPRPVVSMPMASRFNEKVAMDLKLWRGLWILHIIDMWSRYTVSLFIARKRPCDVIDGMMGHWVAVFGVMGGIMTDNGGEFSADEVREVMSILGVKVSTTAGQSPFQNGLCERVHSVTDMMLNKLEAQHGNVNKQTLLCWANMARNSLQMWNGFSSHQLVFGTSPNLPNLMTDSIPALDGLTSSERFAEHLNSLHSARRAFIETEADERIRRALRHKVRASEQVFVNGEHVYYKREGKDRWLGPGSVVFQDGKVVFVRHGGVFIRASPNRLIKKNGGIAVKSGTNLNIESPTDTTKQISAPQDNVQILPSETFDKNNEFSKACGSGIDAFSVNHNNLRPDDVIEYKTDESPDWIQATVLNRAGKATGAYKNRYNVRVKESGEKMSINFDQVIWKRTNEDVNVVMVPRADQKNPDCVSAKERELEKLKRFKTYDEVEDRGQPTISTRWVLTKSGSEIKGRLVARGFEEDDTSQIDSPTVGKGALRIFLTIAASLSWTVKTTDIKSAFLQGRKLERDVFISPPPEANVEHGTIWKLNQCLYGLKDGARQFYLSVRDELLTFGCQQSKYDPALFYVYHDSKLHGLICCHVDDFLHAGVTNFDKEIMDKLRNRFLAGKVEEAIFKYIGFKIIQNADGIVMDQSEYMEDLENGMLSPQRISQKTETLSHKEQKTLRQLVGRINWAVQGSRPDVAFDMIDLSTKLKTGEVSDLARAIKTTNKLKGTTAKVLFPKLSEKCENWHLIVYSDASHANISNGTGSCGAHIVWVMDDSNRCCPLNWNANKIKRVVRSTIAAEALSLQEGLESAYYYRMLLEEILHLEDKTIQIIAVIDNKGVVEAVHSTKLVGDKRLRVDIAAIQESLRLKEVKTIRWCAGDQQLANSMTKQGASGSSLLKVLDSGMMPSDMF